MKPPRTAALVVAVIALAAVVAPARTQAQAFIGSDDIVRGLVPISGLEGIERTMDLDIRFALGSAGLTDPARRQLDALGTALTSEALGHARIRINGHTDARGGAAANKRLSLARAEAVRTYLIERWSVEAARLEAQGFGEERLKNTLDPNAAENRRVEIVNLTPHRPAPQDGRAQSRSNGGNFESIQ